MVPDVAVPLNTMLADLDETLRTLLTRELTRHGFDGVEVAFEAPGKDWAAALSRPTVDLFLYDLQESRERRPIEWESRREGGQTTELRPPLRVDATYTVTAWARAVEDEHRLLSQVLSVLYAYPELPDDVLSGTLAEAAAQRLPLSTRVAQGRADGKADFWSAVGGQLKVSLDYAVSLSCEAGAVLRRGPEVRTQTLRLRDRHDGRRRIDETHRLGGTVRDAAARPVAGAWVVLEGTPRFAESDALGRFVFDRLNPGEYRCRVRAPDGAEAAARTRVPGGTLDVRLGARGRRAG